MTAWWSGLFGSRAPKAQPQHEHPERGPAPASPPPFIVPFTEGTYDVDAVLRSQLTFAVSSGDVVRIVYHGGSRPGSIRDVRPLEITPDYLKAADLSDDGLEKTFRLDRIEMASAVAAVTPPAVVRSIPDDPTAPGSRPFTVEVMRRDHQQQLLAKMVGSTPPPEGLITPARCVLGDEREVRVEISGTVIGALYSKYWWHYEMTIGDAAADCRALITGHECTVVLDLALPPLDPEIAPHAAATYEWPVVRESEYQPAFRAIVRERIASRPAAWVPFVMAHLVREQGGSPSVRVEVSGHLVGFLSRGVAREFWGLAVPPAQVPSIIQRQNTTPRNLLAGDGRYSLQLSLPLRKGV